MTKMSSTVSKTNKKTKEQKPPGKRSRTEAVRTSKSQSATQRPNGRKAKVGSSRVTELRTAAERAMAKGELEQAIDLFSQALASENLPYETEYDLLKGRCRCNDYFGDNSAYSADAQAMFILAKQHEDIPRQAAALVPWADSASNYGASKVKKLGGQTLRCRTWCFFK